MKYLKDKGFYIITTLIAIALFYFITSIIVIGRSSGASMRPTMNARNIFIGNVIDKNYKAGDIISTIDVIHSWNDSTPVLKRIIGVPGDKIVIEGVNTYVNDVLIDSSVLKPGYSYQSYTLKAEEYFIMGDNRSNSWDSRSRGPILISEIRSKVMFWIDY